METEINNANPTPQRGKKSEAIFMVSLLFGMMLVQALVSPGSGSGST